MLILTFTIKKKLKVGFMSLLYIVWYGLVRAILEFVKIGQAMWGNVRAVQLICFICAGIGIILLILLQLGYIKLETPKMYERHFKLVHEPPPYVEVPAGGFVEDSSDLNVSTASDSAIESKNDINENIHSDSNEFSENINTNDNQIDKTEDKE